MVGTPTEFDTLLELCREHHRRIVLAVLATEKRALTINDLTTAIVTHNHHTPLKERSEDESMKIRTALHHVHIPKLANLSLVDYDPERHLVEPTPQFERLEPQLAAILDADPELNSPVAL